jgi:hypothetical protein
MAKRTHLNYDLKDGRKIVYRGTTNDIERRMAEHERAGKRFTHAVVQGARKTPAGARSEERASLARYRRSHRGANPRYNHTDWG